MVRLWSTALAATTTLLSVVPIADAVAPEGTVKHTFEKRRIDLRGPDADLVRRQDRTVNVALQNDFISYQINLTVGTPGQRITLQLDTGSSDIWFPSASARACRQSSRNCVDGTYDETASSTYQQLDLPDFEIAYVDGTEIQGVYVGDDVQIGSTKVTNQTMAAALTVDRGLGVMGIGFQEGQSSNFGRQPFTYPTIIDSLQAQGHINTVSYSLWLDDVQGSTGSILFGGVDTDKYMGSLVVLPIQQDTTSGGFTSMTVAWTGLVITGSGNNLDVSPSTAQPAILDCGSTLTLLPDEIANPILTGVGVTYDDYWGNVVPCNLANDDLTFSFEFGGPGGARVNVSLSEMVVPYSGGYSPRFRNGQIGCQFGIQAAAGRPLLFGDTFLRSAYVVFDLENNEIGLAQTNFNSQPGNRDVQVISSGGGIPDATTTASGASVVQTFTGRPPVTSGGQTTAGGDISGEGTPTFQLTSRTGAATGQATSSGAAASARMGEVDRSFFAMVAVTLGAIMFGVMLL